jgi:glycosyltransferase involved in cell wall biosynthesis
MTARPRVAVPSALRDVNRYSGSGKMWSHVLDRLAGRVDLHWRSPDTRASRFHRAPDVWLSDCGLGPLTVRQPVIIQVHEAGWDEKEIRDLIDPQFLEVVLEGRVGGAVRAASQIITPSNSARQQVMNHWGVPPERVHAVPHGVDAELFRPGRSGGAALLARAGGCPDVPYVLFVSQLHPRKNLAVLRGAMTAIAQRGLPHQLAIVGNAAQDRRDSADFEREVLADLPGAPGRVTRLAELPEPDLADLMAGAAAFCLPSLMEGFGMTVLEAMSCGIPVVTSDRGALPEVVGDAGIVVPPTVEAVRDALERVLADGELATRLGHAARTRAQFLSWERTVDGWCAVISLAAAQRSPVAN